MKAKVTIHEGEAPTEVQSADELEAVLEEAAQDSARLGTPNVVFVEIEGGNCLSLVVGAEPETVIGFVNGRGEPVYFISKGTADTAEPVLLALITMSYPTALLRRWLVPWQRGLEAVREFAATGELPASVEWIEL